MKKPIIIAIVGASGSGKTSLALHLQETRNIPSICSYTTRPMRQGEENGREHWFVAFEHPIPATPLAYTFFGGHHYWTEAEQVQAPITTYVIDEVGLMELKERWSNKFVILSVLIKRPNNDTESSRIIRDEERITLPDSYYDMILLNNSTLNNFLSQASNLIINTLLFN